MQRAGEEELPWRDLVLQCKLDTCKEEEERRGRKNVKLRRTPKAEFINKGAIGLLLTEETT